MDKCGCKRRSRPRLNERIQIIKVSRGTDSPLGTPRRAEVIGESVPASFTVRQGTERWEEIQQVPRQSYIVTIRRISGLKTTDRFIRRHDGKTHEIVAVGNPGPRSSFLTITSLEVV